MVAITYPPCNCVYLLICFGLVSTIGTDLPDTSLLEETLAVVLG
jgi:hypothetical protein